MRLSENISRLKELMGLEEVNFEIKNFNNRIEVGIFFGNEHVGGISLKLNPDDSSHTITSSFIKPKYRGKGLFGKSLFYLLKQEPTVKVKSVLRSPSAQRAWNSLKNKIPYDITFEEGGSKGSKVFYLKKK